MIDQGEIELPFLEYGKYFEPDRTSDFFDLAYTVDMPKRSKTLRDALNIPRSRTTPFQYEDARKKQVSVAFLPYQDGYFFAQVQARREDEGSSKKMMRLFYQVHFIHLAPAILVDILANRKEGFLSLLHVSNKKNDTNTPFALDDFDRIKGQVGPKALNNYIKDNKLEGLYRNTNLFYEDHLYLSVVAPLLRLLDMQKEDKSKKIQLRVVYNEGFSSLDKRLLLLDIIQRMVYPGYGWVSFALDYISNPIGTPPQIQFLSEADEDSVPYPTHIGKENSVRIKVADLEKNAYAEFSHSDYFYALQKFVKMEIELGAPLHEDLVATELREAVKEYGLDGFNHFLAVKREHVNLSLRYWISMPKKEFHKRTEQMPLESLDKLISVFREIIHHPRFFRLLFRKKTLKKSFSAYKTFLEMLKKKYP